jgi:hypothetical protein
VATSPFSELPAILKKHKDAFLRGVDTISREGAIAAGKAATFNTPVDTGLARSNWQASLFTPIPNEVPAYALGKKLGRGEFANFIGATQQQANVIGVWQPAKGTLLFIVNNVGYIGLLNSGGPTTSPNNMLARAQHAWRASIKMPRRILR